MIKNLIHSMKETERYY